MDYLQIAMSKLEQSQGDVRSVDQRDRLTALAVACAAVAQAQDTRVIAECLSTLVAHLDGQGDNPLWDDYRAMVARSRGPA